ncbi:unnamed protein product [Brassica napus]|uniref:(rape) hypothetical protein n=1 Tax=Brassica napus TaxID=3708 RepID=A0A816J6Z2_BRANA|nr:unnamed protein product [Brassica napus]
MAAKLEDDYIDMEVTSFTNLHTFIATGTFTTQVTSNSPFESCTVSPADSCQVSKEPNPKDYFLEYSSSVEEDEKKKSWSKKLRLNTRLSFGKKIKSSRAYLRSILGSQAVLMSQELLMKDLFEVFSSRET